jgi:heme oxygenase (biliverdin-IX-beta and delta-forming)
LIASPGQGRERDERTIVAIVEAVPEHASLRVFLRNRTDAAHQALHLHPTFAVLAGRTGTRDDYARLTAGLAGFYLSIDPLLVAASAVDATLPSYTPRSRLLVEDAAALGATHLIAECNLEEPAGTPEALGWLYVVEGSTLGATVMSARAEDVAGVHAASFWLWCRDNGPRRWKSLVGVMNASTLNDDGRERAARAADQLFMILSAHLDRSERAVAA